MIKVAEKLIQGIDGINQISIKNACKLVTFDVWKRNPMGALMAKGYKEINPDQDTIENIKIMIERGLAFWEEYGPIIKNGFTFEPKGYTKIVDSGDGDYLTKDILWDFKVSKSKPTSKHTLQLLMYWIIGQHSGQEIYKKIQKIGIFNPRLNEIYLFDMNLLSQDIITEIEENIICY